MASRKIVLLMLALLVGVGTFLMFRASNAPPPAQQQAPAETTQILAAARDLPTGAILRESDLKWIPWDPAALSTKLFVKGKVDSTALVGAVLREGLRQDEPFIAGRVVQPHEQGFLAAVLTPGMRAMSVTLTPSAEVAGFIFPGDRVDVILTHAFSRKDSATFNDRYVSETVLVNVRVLALDQKSDNQSTDPKVATLATLEVTPRQAEKLALAADLASGTGPNHGLLSLVLRSLASEEDAAPAPGPAWDSDVSLAYPTVRGEDGLMQKVQVMRGKDVSESTFERHNQEPGQ